MDQREEDRRTLATLLERANEFRLPRATRVKKRLAAGETLTENDIEFLHRVLEDANWMLQIVERNPDYQELASKAIALYTDITKLAVENEQVQRGSTD